MNPPQQALKRFNSITNSIKDKTIEEIEEVESVDKLTCSDEDSVSDELMLDDESPTGDTKNSDDKFQTETPICSLSDSAVQRKETSKNDAMSPVSKGSAKTDNFGTAHKHMRLNSMISVATLDDCDDDANKPGGIEPSSKQDKRGHTQKFKTSVDLLQLPRGGLKVKESKKQEREDSGGSVSDRS